MTKGTNEHKLIQNLSRGDAYSFDEIFKRYNKKIYAFSLQNLKNKEDAENIVQDVFLNLWKDRSKLNNVENIDAWIFTICFNTIQKHFRKLARENKNIENFARSILTEDNKTATEVEYNDLMDKTEEIINKLPERQKNVFLLSKNEGLTNDEISKKLNISKKTVENHLSNARSFIKKMLVDEGLLSLLFYWLFIL